MFLRAGVVLMSLAFLLAVATVAFAATRNGYERPLPVRATHAVPPPEPIARTAEEPEDYSQPWLDIPDPKPPPEPEPKPEPRKPEPKPSPEPKPDPQPAPRPEPKPEPEPRNPRPPENTKERPTPEKDRPEPPGTRSYHLPAGATMGLTVPALGIEDAPVRNSDSQAALDAGVIHLPGTSLPWDEGSRKNVYLAGHRLGWPGTGSFRIFYRLPELRRGDEVMIRDRRGRAYRYRVTEKILVGPDTTWVTRTAPGNDMLSLQTCTPVPTFHKRLIVRAERVEDYPK